MNYTTIVKDCFTAWAKRDWNYVDHALADDFAFTSPYDDHLDKREYKIKCWDPVNEIETFDVVTTVENGDQVFIRYKGCINGTKVQNTEHFVFHNGKIKEITVFFGRP